MNKNNIYIFFTTLLSLSSCVSINNSNLINPIDSNISLNEILQKDYLRYKKEMVNKINHPIEVFINTNILEKNKFRTKSSLRRKIFLAKDKNQKKSSLLNINDQNIISGLDIYAGDISIGNNSTLSGLVLENSPEYMFETGVLIVKFKNKDTDIDLLKKIYNFDILDESQGFYKIKLDLKNVKIDKSEELINNMISKMPINLQQIDFSSIASIKTFLIYSDILLNYSNIVDSVQLNALSKQNSSNDITINVNDSIHSNSLLKYSIKKPYPIKTWWLDYTNVMSVVNKTNQQQDNVTDIVTLSDLDKRINPKAWKYSIGTNTKTGIIDSGFNISHKELKRRILLENNNNIEYNTVNKDNCSLLKPTVNHGTLMSLIFGAEKNNDVDMLNPTSVGVSPNGFISPYINKKFLWIEFTWDVYNNVLNSVENGDKIINISSNTWDPFYYASIITKSYSISTIGDALSKGVTIVNSAGNDANDVTGFFSGVIPGRFTELKGLIVVGGVDIRPYKKNYEKREYVDSFYPDFTASFRYAPLISSNDCDSNNKEKGSNYGKDLVWAPWQFYFSTATIETTTDSYDSYNIVPIEDVGTSGAAAFTSGVVSLMKSRNPDLTPAEVEDILHKTATIPIKPHENMENSNFSDLENMKLINAEEAVKEAIRRNKQSVSNPRSNNPDDYIAKEYRGTFTLDSNALNDNSTNNKVIGTLTLDNGSSIDLLRTVSNEELQKANGKYVKAFAWAPEVTKFSEGYELLSIEETTNINNKIAFIEKNLLYTVNSDGSNLKPIAQTSDLSLSWSPDKSKIAYISDEAFTLSYVSPPSSKLVVTDAEGTSKVKVSKGGTNTRDSYPVWSYDGTKIAFFRHDIIEDKAYLCTININDSSENILLEIPKYTKSLSWSRDNSKISYVAQNPDTLIKELHVFDGTTDRKLFDNVADNSDWTLDNQIVYTKDDMIMKCSIDGTTNITLTTGLKPNISNNGTKIAFMNKNNLFTMDINGSNIKRLTNYYDPSGVYLENFSWSQDDSGILFDYNDISDYKYHISKIENNYTTELYSSVEDSLLYINNMKWSIKNKKDNKQMFLNNIAW